MIIGYFLAEKTIEKICANMGFWCKTFRNILFRLLGDNKMFFFQKPITPTLFVATGGIFHRKSCMIMYFFGSKKNARMGFLYETFRTFAFSGLNSIILA